MKIDAHQHFWHYTEADYGWISAEQGVLQRDFLPEDLAHVLNQSKLEGCIAVQARQTLIETNWLLDLAQEYAFIKGVVGWIDLKSKNLTEQLTDYKANAKLVGFRHVLQDEIDPNFMLEEAFIAGLKTIEAENYTYDLLIFSHQLPQACELAKQFTKLPIVIDHIAKPKIGNQQEFAAWQLGINTLAKHDNVYCKVSGMVTEADVNNWTQEDFTPYLTAVFDAFGPSRIMFGSDWPVCLLGGEYPQIKDIVSDFVNQYYPTHFDAVFGENAARFYKIQ
ncbi:amidohydrolase family protein [Algibacillus agarilyticus]|uniref:amidohydrolase family protein n=1 Tax=Algibacillus agarilyticus TaxID=2234133 RepID=UPI000DD02859|nr:amidohydrolase family protein [Algibacillus agarilyticus]